MAQPTPAIVAQAAVRRLPRWALWLFCAAYVVPGFVGREPWRNADMAAFGYMRALAGGTADWWKPLLGGMPPETDGLLPYWLGAWVLRLLPDDTPLQALAARLPFAALLVLTLACTWYAVYYLARSPRAQPVAFAFGGEAAPADYARAIADGGLLALVACLGLAQLSHEGTAYLTQLACTSLVFYALAAIPYRLVIPAVALVAGLGGLVLSGAPSLAAIFGMGGALVCWLDGSERPGGTEAAPMGRRALGIAGAAVGALLLALALDLLHWRADLPADGGRQWQSLGRLLLWFTWPAWPLALWTLWRWRRQWAARGVHRHIALPLWFAGVTVAATLLTQPADRALLLGLPALATLAAFALPTFSRNASALVDWFTLLFFSGAAITVWVVWIAMQTGIPRQPAANVAKLAPGFVPSFSWLAFGVALVATAAWAALVAWRVGRHRTALWKSMVLPAGGAALGWVLLMTLWLPLLDYARSYVAQVDSVMRTIDRPGCIEMHGLTRGEVAALQYHAGLAVQPAGPSAACPWLLVATDQTGTLDQTVDLRQWSLANAARRPTERVDRLLIYRRR